MVEANGATPEAMFQAGSVSKPVAALAALRLAESGVFDQDSRVNDQLESWRLPAGEQVTVRMLLSHTAGLGVGFLPGYPRTSALPSLPQVLDGLPPANTPPVRIEDRPGESFRYSGGGFVLLQLLVEDVTGTPFAEIANDLVFEPLGMVSSTFEQPLPEALHSAAAAGHVDGQPVDGGWRVYPEAGAVGCGRPRRTSAGSPSVSSWPSRTTGVLARETALLLTTPAVRLPEEGEWTVLRELGVQPPHSFGLGVFLDDLRFCHLGGSAGFFCGVFGSLGDGTGAALMTDREPGPEFFKILLEVAAEHRWPGFRCEAAGSSARRRGLGH